MAANKRRKLDGDNGSSGSSTPTGMAILQKQKPLSSIQFNKVRSNADCDPAMSAFAARQQLWGTAVAKNNNVEKKTTPEPVPENPRSAQSRKSETPSARSVVGRRAKRQSPEAPVVSDAKQAQGIEAGTGGSG